MTTTFAPPGVVVVAPSDDQHADAVQKQLDADGVATLYLDLSAVLTRQLEIRPGAFVRVDNEGRSQAVMATYASP